MIRLDKFAIRWGVILGVGLWCLLAACVYVMVLG